MPDFEAELNQTQVAAQVRELLQSLSVTAAPEKLNPIRCLPTIDHETLQAEIDSWRKETLAELVQAEVLAANRDRRPEFITETLGHLEHCRDHRLTLMLSHREGFANLDLTRKLEHRGTDDAIELLEDVLTFATTHHERVEAELTGELQQSVISAIINPPLIQDLIDELRSDLLDDSENSDELRTAIDLLRLSSLHLEVINHRCSLSEFRYLPVERIGSDGSDYFLVEKAAQTVERSLNQQPLLLPQEERTEVVDHFRLQLLDLVEGDEFGAEIRSPRVFSQFVEADQSRHGIILLRLGEKRETRRFKELPPGVLGMSGTLEELTTVEPASFGVDDYALVLNRSSLEEEAPLRTFLQSTESWCRDLVERLAEPTPFTRDELNERAGQLWEKIYDYYPAFSEAIKEGVLISAVMEDPSEWPALHQVHHLFSELEMHRETLQLFNREDLARIADWLEAVHQMYDSETTLYELIASIKHWQGVASSEPQLEDLEMYNREWLENLIEENRYFLRCEVPECYGMLRSLTPDGRETFMQLIDRRLIAFDELNPTAAALFNTRSADSLARAILSLRDSRLAADSPSPGLPNGGFLQLANIDNVDDGAWQTVDLLVTSSPLWQILEEQID